MSILEQAKEITPKNEDGSWDEQKLIENVASFIKIDPKKEKIAKAKRLINSETKPRGTEPDGQLRLPGLNDIFNYEPKRLIRDDAGHIIENTEAVPEFKAADVRRSLVDLNRKQRWHNRKFAELNVFQRWALEEASKGRPLRELTWGTCISELNLWHEGLIEDDIGDDDPGSS